MTRSQQVNDPNNSDNVDANHTDANDSNGDNASDGDGADKGPPPPLASPASARAANTRAREFHLCREKDIEARLGGWGC